MQTEQLHRLMPFARVLGLELRMATPERVEASTGWAPERCTVGGVLHGGFLAAVADSVGAVCAALNLPEGATGTATIEAKTNLLRGVRGGTVTATAEPVHLGGTTIVVQTDVRDQAGALVSRTLQTQAVLRSRA